MIAFRLPTRRASARPPAPRSTSLRSNVLRSNVLRRPAIPLAFLLCGLACSSSTSGTSTGTGGKPAGSGGSAAPGSGGTSAGNSGGSSAGTGGAVGSGGAVSATGGQPSGTGGSAQGSGGRAEEGGRSGSGGATSGTGGTTNRDAGTDATAAGTGGVKADAGSSGGATGTAGSTGTSTKFSFSVTSLGALQMLSGNEKGFGGDLRFGEATGLAGADKICSTIAEKALMGSGSKGWHAFLSTVSGPVHASDRIGAGPWYDRLGRLVANNKADLLNDRPKGADPAIINDLPNENGIPNHTDGMPGCTNNCPDNHDVLTGTGADGKLKSTNVWSTCHDWTDAQNVAPASDVGGIGGGKGPWCGHSWPRQGSGTNWMASLSEAGCAPGVNLKDNSGPMGSAGNYTVGAGGGYGAFYCFATTP